MTILRLIPSGNVKTCLYVFQVAILNSLWMGYYSSPQASEYAYLKNRIHTFHDDHYWSQFGPTSS